MDTGDKGRIQKIFNVYRNLTQNRGKSDDEVWALAEKAYLEEKVDIDITSKFKNSAERKSAKALLKKYLSDYTIETISDKNTLKEVIYLETVQTRLQDKLNDFYESENKSVPFQLVDIIHKNSDAIVRLKNTLGLNRGKEKKSAYDVLEHLKKRAKKWREENQASRSRVCPHCSKLILWKIRTDKWDMQKHPFFKDRILYNKHLIELHKKGTLTREDVAKVLECAPDYVDWILEKIERKQ